MADSTPSTETWRPVVGWPGYEVSDMGRVRSIERRIPRGRFTAIYKSKQLTPQPKFDDRGRIVAFTVQLSGGGKHPLMRVHRLVLEAFIGPCPDGLEGCHNDGDPSHNHVGNLRWDTPKANAQDAVRHGTRPNGERHHCAKLTLAAIAEIRSIAVWKRGDQKRLAEKYGVSAYAIYGARTGKYWRSAPGAIQAK